MKRLNQILIAVVFSSLTGGCLVSGTVRTHAYATTPDLVYVQPGVQVVADYDEPVFYSDGYYWRYYDNTWYRSDYYSGGWVRYRNVPRAVVTINHPYAYVHYHARGNANGHYNNNRPRVEDHRRAVREDRRERREDKREHREDRRERRDNRRDNNPGRVKVRDHRH
jgi:hypothetical protein